MSDVSWWDKRSGAEKALLIGGAALAIVGTGGAVLYAVGAEGAVLATGTMIVAVGKAARDLAKKV